MRSKAVSMYIPAIVLFLTVSTKVAGAESVDEEKSTSASAKLAAGEEESKWRLFDDFDGELALPWVLVRPDPTHVSLIRCPGTLTIVTQVGSITGSEKARATAGGIQMKNLHLVLNPSVHEGDFAVLTCLKSFSPTVPWQQAGLIIYKDDDNFLKWETEANRRSKTGVALACLHETNGKRHSTMFEAVPNLTRLWLRVIKRGNYYQHAYSVDGENYVVLGEEDWGEGKPQRVGLFAKSGGTAPETDASFDFFEVRPLSELEKTHDAERERLQGKWETMADRERGRPEAESTVTQFAFSNRTLVVRENTQTFEGQYTFDVASSPKELVLSKPGNWQNKKPLRIAYTIEGDRLTICFNPQPGGAKAATLEAKDGESRVLTTLRRVKADN